MVFARRSPDRPAVPVCALADLPRGRALPVDLDGVAVVVVHADDGTVHALRDRCSHGDVPLSEGEVVDCTLECWLHGSRFDLHTGRPTGPPATAPVSVYPVEIHDGHVYVSPTPRRIRRGDTPR